MQGIAGYGSDSSDDATASKPSPAANSHNASISQKSKLLGVKLNSTPTPKQSSQTPSRTSSPPVAREDQQQPIASTSSYMPEESGHTIPQQPLTWGLADYGIQPIPPDIQCDAAIEAKLANFHRLRQQGVYFNDNLFRNKSFRNPNILPKLVKFVHVDEKASNFDKRVWDPLGFPEDAYYDKIAEKQQDRLNRVDSSKARSGIDFSPATASSKDKSKHAEHPGSSKKSRWDHKNGKRDRSRSPVRRDRDR